MPGTAKALLWCTAAALVAVTAYSAVFGRSGRLWLGVVVLGLLAAGAAAARRG